MLISAVANQYEPDNKDTIMTFARNIKCPVEQIQFYPMPS